MKHNIDRNKTGWKYTRPTHVQYRTAKRAYRDAWRAMLSNTHDVMSLARKAVELFLKIAIKKGVRNLVSTFFNENDRKIRDIDVDIEMFDVLLEKFKASRSAYRRSKKFLRLKHQQADIAEKIYMTQVYKTLIVDFKLKEFNIQQAFGTYSKEITNQIENEEALKEEWLTLLDLEKEFSSEE